MIIDGNDLQTIAILRERGPSRNAASVSQIISGAPGAWRRIRMGRGAPDPLQIVCIGGVVGDPTDPNGGTQAQMQGNLDKLKYWTRADKELTVSWSDIANRQWKGYRQRLDVGGIPPEWVTQGVHFALRILCPVPFAEDDSLSSPNTSGSSPLTITPNVGTAPYPVVIKITGNNTANLGSLVIQYRDKADTVIHSLTYTGTLTGSQQLIIDTEAMTAVIGSTNEAGNISGTYFDINPGDGDYLGSPAGPDVNITFTGTCDDFTVEYRRRWQ